MHTFSELAHIGIYIPNQSADSEIKTKDGSPRVAPYDMMMWLCHELMIDTV